MSWIKSKSVPVGTVFVIGIMVIAAYFLDIPILSQTSKTLQSWAIVLVGFTVIIGLINTIVVHVKYIQRRKEDQWLYSVVLLVLLAINIPAGLVNIMKLQNPIYVFLSQRVYGPLAGAMYSSLGFWIISAGYRALRLRNLESAVLLSVAVLVMFGNAPIGELIWSGFPQLKNWILDVPSAGAVRAVLIGGGIAGIYQGFRIILGYEKRYLGGT